MKEWLQFEHRRHALFVTTRVKRSLHRTEEEDLAQGVWLPPPAPHVAVYGKVHRALFFEKDASRTQRLAALAAGGSVWHMNRYLGLPRDQWHVRCMCGQQWPSRPHLAFQSGI